MELSVLLPILEIFGFIFMPACGFVLIPTTFKSCLKWRKTKNPNDFSSMVVQGVFSLCLVISVFPLFASRLIGFYSLNNSWIYGILASLMLGAVIGYWTLPKMLSHYQKLRVEFTATHFTLMVIFGVLSFYGLSSFFILMFHSIVSTTG